ncbi:hypothetical protein JFK97_19085 [Chromobacterium phragmitis]|uniref:hypothetical protein n=1 Tax=Chromobacterium amazonense TaxID=1382803 RepID=UPI0021B7DA90|nr:hypothetical protein [Chromobacterium amazonense]MBM2886498.1 hypothetical protein [Chromobacterium amazonense]
MKKLVLLAGLGFSGCSYVPQHVVAQKNVDVYKAPIDGTQDVAFVVRAGDRCVFTEEQQNKVYLFKRVECGDQSGWTPDWADFKVQK